MAQPIQNDNPLCIIFFALTRQNYRCEKCCVLFIKYFFNEAITVIEILLIFRNNVLPLSTALQPTIFHINGQKEAGTGRCSFYYERLLVEVKKK